YELKNGHLDQERHWWVQAEAVVGYQYMAKIFNEDAFNRKAEALWSYIQQYIVDKENGEWYWSRMENGSVNEGEDKAGFWKCPYHNGRMCLEMISSQGRSSLWERETKTYIPRSNGPLLYRLLRLAVKLIAGSCDKCMQRDIC